MYLLSLPIIERKRVTEHVAEVIFGLEGRTFDFKPGQFVRVVVPKLLARDMRGASRDFSISSPPNGETISIVFRSTAPSGFKQTLLSLPLGERVSLSGPYGELTLPSSSARALIFVAGGIGVTAFASKIQEALASTKNYRITLLWSATEEANVPHLPLLRELAREHSARFTLVEIFGARIDSDILKKHLKGRGRTRPLFQVAGPPEMVTAVCTMLANLNVKEKDIAFEEYQGCDSTPRPHPVDVPIAHADSLTEAAHLSSMLSEGLLEALDKTAIVSKTDADGTILFVNDTFIKVSKYSREELIGQNHRILKSGHHPQKFYRDLWRTISSGHIWRGEIKNRAKDGSYYWVDTSIAPIIGKDGIPERYVSVRFVITDKKEAEEKLSQYRTNLENMVREQTTKLSDSNKSLKSEIVRRVELEKQLRMRAETLAQSDRNKDEFIAVLSHELRNPLSPAISSVELITMQGTDHPSTPYLVETTRNNLNTIAHLLDDLLDVNRITQKKFKLGKQVIAVQEVLRRAMENVSPLAKEKRQRIVVSLPDQPVWIQVDPLRLNQIFTNVLSNAVKYTGDSGIIEVHCARGEDAAVITIKDNGIGISKDMQKRIFEMFARVEKTTVAGLGIGLSLTKQLVEMHGGTIKVKSEGEGMGSEFEIRLPMSKSEQHRVRALDDLSPRGGSKPLRILVVDDNVAAANGLGALLKHRGHQITLANGWREALKVAPNGFDVILLDINMPEVDGYDLARRIIREVVPSPALIALTGYGQEEDKRKAEKAGFALHLTKPVALADIEEALLKISLF